jgi:hypothetical protein
VEKFFKVPGVAALVRNNSKTCPAGPTAWLANMVPVLRAVMALPGQKVSAEKPPPAEQMSKNVTGLGLTNDIL